MEAEMNKGFRINIRYTKANVQEIYSALCQEDNKRPHPTIILQSN